MIMRNSAYRILPVIPARSSTPMPRFLLCLHTLIGV
jgi:hypothetical protein